MAEKIKYTQKTSPKAEAFWPKVDKPDYKFNKEGRLSCDIVLDPEDEAHAKLMLWLDEQLEEAWKYQVGEDPSIEEDYKKKKSYRPIVDKETKKKTGLFKLTIGAKASFGDGKERKVAIFDTKKTPIKGTPIGHGSLVQVSFTFDPRGYAMTSSETVGLSLKPKAVMVHKMATYDGDGSGDFDDVEDDEGYVHDGAASVSENEDSADF